MLLTPGGYEALKGELDTLRTERRREIAERIRTAREFGDIAENAEYDDAKNEQAMLEHKIAQLEDRLAHARVIDTDDVDTSVVSVGSVVRLRDVDAKQTVEYHIVGSAEANPAEQKLSNESPVGKAIIGHKKGETVEVTTPRGSVVKFKTMEIKAACPRWCPTRVAHRIAAALSSGGEPEATGQIPFTPRGKRVLEPGASPPSWSAPGSVTRATTRRRCRHRTAMPL